MLERIRRPATVLLASAALAALAGCSTLGDLAAAAEGAAHTEAVAAPDWQPGSFWRYSDGYALMVEAGGGGAARFRRLDDPSQWFTRRGFLRDQAQSGTGYREVIYRSILPEAGLRLSADEPLTFQREYTRNGELIVHATSWTVEGRQRIAVPAGEFDCWIIVMRTRSMTGDWAGFERWWYSPEAQHYVRMEYQYGRTPVASRVLVDYGIAEAVTAAR